jgi:polyhydroxyalkanoate synthesis repressor PhaR
MVTKKISKATHDNLHHNDTVETCIVIKKYANRRLYNMAESHYITLDDLAGLIRSSVNFVVYDAKTGEDITRSILTQIIVEQESKGNHLLPMSFLRDMIKIYGDNVNGLVPDYWDNTMRIFKENRDTLQKGYDTAIQGITFPLEQFRKVADSNTSLFSRTIDIFNIFNPKKTSSDEITISQSEYDSLVNEIVRLRHIEVSFNKANKPSIKK